MAGRNTGLTKAGYKMRKQLRFGLGPVVRRRIDLRPGIPLGGGGGGRSGDRSFENDGSGRSGGGGGGDDDRNGFSGAIFFFNHVSQTSDQ